MLCGHAPFYGQSLSTEEIMERIRAGQFSFDAPEWIRVSQAAKSIIEGTKYKYMHDISGMIIIIELVYWQNGIICSTYKYIKCQKFYIFA